MKIAVIGDEVVKDRDSVFLKIANAIDLAGFKNNTILTGISKGVESVALDVAYRRGFDSIVFRATHELDKRMKESDRSVFLKYLQILENADRVVVVQREQEENPLAGVIEFAKRRAIPVVLVSL